ncbi:glycosyltransferase family 2 protein [Komagataeibacter sp. FNDCR2]|uniref:glycosyltransferase family 2 protein n=1 Tax=Komagataeibacter sp. FNDCR2 TaxID=2878682 RepID=UPI001E59E7CA|nr:glycosyltransferase family A protein [Komagataeibacter sp. FNDCR2]MCE2574199.1 glycosyltransferase [Komagataeibacter sp. FNDCR2]
MFFSLIVPTLGRVGELRALLDSLTRQSLTTFEVIIVDQNGDDRLVPVVNDFTDRLNITHLRSTVRQCNHARNLGAKRAVGDIVTFPDDDCVYTDTVLQTVNELFASFDKPDFITGSVITLEGLRGKSGRWHPVETPINSHNVWTCLIEFNFFIRRTAFTATGGFDEGVGPGTTFGSAEGQDLALRLLEKGFRGLYVPSLHIMHPDKPVTLTTARAYSYGLGMGHVMRKNHVGVATVGTFLLRSVMGGLVYLLKGDIPRARYYFLTFLGRIRGYLSLRAGAVTPAPATG